MKYLVTGGAGFVGSNLTENLVKENHEVIVLDNLHTGSMDNLEAIKDKITVVNSPCSDVLKIDIVKNLDGIFHLGVPSSSPMYKRDPLLVGRAINDFIQILELAKREKCKIVFASSSSVYNGNQIPWKEDMEIKVSDFYTEARYAMERMAKLYYDLFNVRSVGLRFFSVYGPKEEAKKEYANLISQFLWSLKNNEQPVVYGDGSQTRDFIYVEDVVNACNLAMNSEIDCDVFNVGTGKNYSLNEIIDMLNEMLGTSVRAKYVDNPIKNYVKDTLADTTKAKEKLGFEARYNVRDGIKKLIGFL